jgi:redox-sensitive bicupin YhaK (pirin superfamily)
MSIRAVKRITPAQPTLEGAGVHLRRAFGFGTTQEFDPFLTARAGFIPRNGDINGG